MNPLVPSDDHKPDDKKKLDALHYLEVRPRLVKTIDIPGLDSIGQYERLGDRKIVKAVGSNLFFVLTPFASCIEPLFAKAEMIEGPLDLASEELGDSKFFERDAEVPRGYKFKDNPRRIKLPVENGQTKEFLEIEPNDEDEANFDAFCKRGLSENYKLLPAGEAFELDPKLHPKLNN